MHTSLHIFVHSLYTCLFTCLHPCLQYTHVDMHMPISMHMHKANTHVCKYLHAHVCSICCAHACSACVQHVCAHAHTDMHGHTQAYMHACARARMHACAGMRCVPPVQGRARRTGVERRRRTVSCGVGRWDLEQTAAATCLDTIIIYF